MKFLTLIAAALVAATGTAATAAPAPAAQDRVVVRERVVSPGVRNTRVVSRERTTVTRRGYDRPRYRTRNVCRTTVRYGERRRVCRRVRYRY